MVYGSVCAGIEAATVAWHPLRWRPAFFAEIDAFPRAVIAHHYANVPLHGDFTTIEKGQYADIDVLVGGTPCQSFSVAGLRKGLSDERGNLALEFLRLAQRLRPEWVVWENLPGVLSSNGGRDFGTFLGGLVECGYGFATECWTLTTSEHPCGAVVSTLSAVLETGAIPQRYYLSERQLQTCNARLPGFRASTLPGWQRGRPCQSEGDAGRSTMGTGIAF